MRVSYLLYRQYVGVLYILYILLWDSSDIYYIFLSRITVSRITGHPPIDDTITGHPPIDTSLTTTKILTNPHGQPGGQDDPPTTRTRLP